MPQLLNNASATGAAAQWPGGAGMVDVVGTFGGATVTLQFLGPDGATWITVGADSTFTAAGGALFMMRAGKLRMAVSGGAPSGLYASAEPVKG